MSDGKVHSRFGGSKAGRWMNCAGSVALCASVPAKPSGPYAAEGTAAHAFAEHFLTEGERDAMQHVGMTLDAKVDAVPLTEEMAAAVQVYLDAVWAEVDAAKDAELYVEKGFVLDVPSAQPGEVFGTNDAMVYTPSRKRLVVFDYKHGAGVSVSADDNAQLKFYASGAVFANPDWKLKDVELIIVQPRARDFEEAGPVKRWPMPLEELLDFTADADTAISAAKSETGQLSFEPGSWCRWCDAAAFCPAKQRQALEAATLSFKDVTMITVDDLPEPKTLDTERLAKIVAALGLISAWAGQCQEYMEALLLSGVEIPGWKVVEKLGRRKWTSADEEIADTLDMLFGIDADRVRPRKLTTITDAEKLMKAAGATKEQIEDVMLRFTIKESSGKTIAPMSDKRDAVNAVAAFTGVNTDGFKT